jgi:hypothetical protein
LFTFDGLGWLLCLFFSFLFPCSATRVFSLFSLFYFSFVEIHLGRGNHSEIASQLGYSGT